MSEDNTPRRVQFGRIPSRPIHAGVLAGLRGADAKVYIVLASHADENYRCQVGVRRLAKLTGHLEGTISESIKALELAGLLRVHRGRNGQASTYVLVDTVQPQPNGSSVQPQPNGHTETVQLQTGRPFSHSRTNRSATAERNRVNNRIEQAADRAQSPDSDSGGDPMSESERKAELAKMREMLKAKKSDPSVSDHQATGVSHG